MTTFATFAEPSLSAISDAGMQTTCDLGKREIFRQALASVNDGAAGRDLEGELAQGDLVHRDEHVGTRQQRRSDSLFREADVAMRAAGAHLGTVGRQPADFEAFAHAHLGEKLAEQQHALAAEAGDLDIEMVGTGDGVRAQKLRGQPGARLPPTSCTVLCGGSLLFGISTLRSRKTFSGKLGIIFSATHLRASTGSLPQMVGQGERISTKVNPAPSRCSSSALRTARRAFMMFLLSESATRSM